MRKWAVVLAGCAWVLWTESTTVWGPSMRALPVPYPEPSWHIDAVYDTRQQCEKDRPAQIESTVK